MVLEIVRGTAKNLVAIQSLIDSLKASGAEGTFFIGYPIMASADASHTVEALLVSTNFGLVAFNCPESEDSEEAIKDEQDQLFYVLEGNLKKHETLRSGRKLAVIPNVVSFFPVSRSLPQSSSQYRFACPDTLANVLSDCEPISSEYYKPLCAAIQRVTTIKPVKKRENIRKRDSKGAILKIIEKNIANLDQWQKKAAIEIPNAPQRVRGLAGSGKTVVLALKAAYMHSQNPEWDIAVTFHTRSLRPQFTDLIERFTLEHSGDKPNWEKLKILHSWGSSFEAGVYSEISDELKIVPINFGAAKARYGTVDAFAGICNEALSYMSQRSINPIYDAVLIDEAQDLPPSFFKLVYAATKNPKRIIVAYDELQNLSNTTMPPVEELFGTDENNVPLVSFRNNENEPLQDIILPICYRNSPWTLTLAHALGFGIYRTAGLVQLFDDLELWKDIGYNVESGRLAFNQNVIMKRREDSFPEYFKEYLNPKDSINIQKFDTKLEQYEWIAQDIQKNIETDELDPDDILIIFPDAYSAKREFQQFHQSMIRRGLRSHLAGVSTDRDTFSFSDSVTASSIFRAKGNEAPMVYIVNSDYCAIGHEMIKLRNILFTAITRSRGWVSICGTGSGLDLLYQEIAQILENDYKLAFKIPTREELDNIRLINRDRTSEENKKINNAVKQLKEIRALIDAGIINPDALAEFKSIFDGNLNSQNREPDYE